MEATALGVRAQRQLPRHRAQGLRAGDVGLYHFQLAPHVRQVLGHAEGLRVLLPGQRRVLQYRLHFRGGGEARGLRPLVLRSDLRVELDSLALIFVKNY